MDYRLELEIWDAVRRSMPTDVFTLLVTEAVRSYRRRPGYIQLDRLHESDIGAEGVEVLGTISSRAGLSDWSSGGTFVSIRAHLREHVYEALQRHLISSSLASKGVIDNSMARDLGL